MRHITIRKLLLFACALLFTCIANGKKPIKTLLITGQNNHNWKVSHVVIKDILEQSGLFKVDLAISPKQGDDMAGFILDFTEYPVVVLDYNGDEWPQETKDRFEQYARNGGGIIIYHAADNSFPQWDAYNQICGLGGWGGRNEKSGPYAYWLNDELIKDYSPGHGGSHGDNHEFMLNARNTTHPITSGLPNRWVHGSDELYDRMRGPANINAVLYTAYADKARNGSGREEPQVFTVEYGKARIFHTTLGHCGPTYDNNPSMQCTGFQVLLLRAAEWAATGKVKQKVPKDFPTSSYITYRRNYKEPEE
jgi:hypothetical protein